VTKSRIASLLGSLALLGTLFVVLPGLGADEKKEKGGKDGLYRPLGLFTEVLSLVRGNYVEKVDVKPLLAGAFSGMTEAMDPFTEYVPPEKMAAFEAARAAREKADHVESGLVLARRAGYPVVVTAVPGSPAAAAGVRTDDILEKVGEVSARSLSLWEVEAALSGRPGGKANVLVVRDAKPRRQTVDIVRASWKPELPAAERVSGELVVKIPAFGPGTADALAGLLAPLDRSKSLVLDLRGNGWGSWDEAARAASLLGPAGPLGKLEGRKIAGKSWKAEPGQRVHEGGLVLLVDSGTAGPAELFVASLRENAAKELGVDVGAVLRREQARAEREAEDEVLPTPAPTLDKQKLRVRVVGEPTFGMGITQEVVRLASGGALKITVGKVRTAAGRSLSPRGVEPDDRVFHVLPEEGEEGKTPDPFLSRALKVVSELPAVPARAS
jgi:carboxyl-terminal processing protease